MSVELEHELKVPEFEDVYVVSKQGYVKNIKTGRILKSTQNHRFTVNLRNSGKYKFCTVGRLVYSIFNNVKLKKNHLIVHEDGNPLNCNLDNLKLITKRNYSTAIFKNKTGYSGVYKTGGEQYVTRIKFEGTRVKLHSSFDKTECHKIYQLAKTLMEDYDRKKTEILSNMAKNRLMNKSVSSGVF
jgi:hypothetical protein